MDAKQISNYILARGYEKVTVKEFSKSSRLYVRGKDWAEVRNLGVPLSELNEVWLDKKYPIVIEWKAYLRCKKPTLHCLDCEFKKQCKDLNPTLTFLVDDKSEVKC